MLFFRFMTELRERRERRDDDGGHDDLILRRPVRRPQRQVALHQSRPGHRQAEQHRLQGELQSMYSLNNTGVGYNVDPGFSEFCSCCSLPILPLLP